MPRSHLPAIGLVTCAKLPPCAQAKLIQSLNGTSMWTSCRLRQLAHVALVNSHMWLNNITLPMQRSTDLTPVIHRLLGPAGEAE